MKRSKLLAEIATLASTWPFADPDVIINIRTIDKDGDFVDQSFDDLAGITQGDNGSITIHVNAPTEEKRRLSDRAIKWCQEANMIVGATDGLRVDDTLERMLADFSLIKDFINQPWVGTPDEHPAIFESESDDVKAKQLRFVSGEYYQFAQEYIIGKL